jgi:plastocyanin
MTRVVAVLAGLALAIAPAAAEGRPGAKHRGAAQSRSAALGGRAAHARSATGRGDAARARYAPLRGHARPPRAKAPATWSAPPGFLSPAAATPTPTDPAPQPTPSPSPTPTPVATVPAPSPNSVSVGATEFAFTLSQATVDPGDVRVQFDNTRAEDPHQLIVFSGSELYDFGELAPGEVKRMTLPLKSGTYQLLCPLPDHEAKGMRARLTVR